MSGEGGDDVQASAVGLVVVGVGDVRAGGAAAVVGDAEGDGVGCPVNAEAEVGAGGVGDGVRGQLGDDQGGVVGAGAVGEDVAGPAAGAGHFFGETWAEQFPG